MAYASKNLTLQPLLLSERQTAAVLGFSPRFVFGLRQSGELPAVKAGSRIAYAVSDIEDFIRRHRITPNPETAAKHGVLAADVAEMAE